MALPTTEHWLNVFQQHLAYRLPLWPGQRLMRENGGTLILNQRLPPLPQQGAWAW